MIVLCALFSCFLFVVSTTDATGCPTGAPSSVCTCSKVLEYWKVVCQNSDEITEIPSWLPPDTRILEIVSCDIETLNGSSFKNLVNVTTVQIKYQKNRLTLNGSSVFQGLNRLTTIEIDGNNIISLPAGLFANLPGLSTVSLDGNPLQTLPEDLFENSTNLQTLRIGKTQLDKDTLGKIGAGHFGTNIASLLISETRIQRLNDGFFSGLLKLRFFVAAKCEINSIGADILKGTQLPTLILDENAIELIDENAFRDSAALTQFRCRNCQLTSNVTFNGFLKKISALTNLDLQNNNITSVPKDAFVNLKGLRIINLSNNLIATIEKNPYANLPECDDSTCIQLHDNPLNCDCNLAWLRSFAGNIKGNLDGWKCAKPKNVAGKSLTALKVNEFCCKVSGETRCAVESKAWVVSAHILVAIVSQIVVMFGIPLLFA